MDVYSLIMHYVHIYFGSEQRIVEKVSNELRLDEIQVIKALNWLVEKGFLKVIPFNDLKGPEKDYYRSDRCAIYRKVKHYDEVEFRIEESKRKQKEDLLPNKEKFKLYFLRLEEHFKKYNIFNGKNYTYRLW